MKVTRFVKIAAIVSTLAFVMTAMPASAAVLTKDGAKCRSTIAKGIGKFNATAMKTIAGCHKSRNGSKIGDVDCNDLATADSKGKAGKAETKFRESFAKCVPAEETAVVAEFGPCPAPHDNLDDTGVADNIDTFDELADCLVAHGTTWSERASENALGRPVVADLTKDTMKCAGTIAKTMGKLMSTIAKDRAKCQAGVDKLGIDAEIVGFAASSCVNADPKTKIAGALTKLSDGMIKACTAGTDAERKAMDSCASSTDGLTDCVGNDIATNIGGGLTASAWELPSACNFTGVEVQVNPGFGSEINTATRLDTGWTGAGFGADVTEGFLSRVKLNNCTADCSNCEVALDSNVGEDFGNCRCIDELETKCEADSGIPNTASAACPASGTCRCYFGAPLPLSAVGVSTCVVTSIVDELDGLANLGTGEGSTTVSSVALVFDSETSFTPCPTCDGDGTPNDGVRGGICAGGGNAGNSCDQNGTSATFGDLSYECQPSAGKNIAGTGLRLNLALTNEAASTMAPLEACTDGSGDNCYCRECFDDNTVGCNQDSDCLDAGLTANCGIDTQCALAGCVVDADCSAVGLGTCNLFGDCSPAVPVPCDGSNPCTGPATCTGPSSEPVTSQNDCDGGTCTPVGADGYGTCDADPQQGFCDGFIQSVNNADNNNLRGVLPCLDNTDCDGFDQGACGGDCGICSHLETKRCFVGTISATGSAGTRRSELVSTFCAGSTSNSVVNSTVGSPGPGKLKIDFTFSARCADGSAAQLPGGLNCEAP